MPDKIRILGIYGSLRAESFNRKLIYTARELCPAEADFQVFERLGELPLFSEDIEQKPPQVVRELKQAIRSCDAVLFATPEYNYTLPGVLKNAIDWASRPYGESAWDGKCAAVMGASVGRFGSARAQYDLRRACVYLNMHAVPLPEVMVTSSDSFSADGKLADERTSKLISELLQNLVQLARALTQDKQRAAAAAG